MEIFSYTFTKGKCKCNNILLNFYYEQSPVSISNVNVILIEYFTYTFTKGKCKCNNVLLNFYYKQSRANYTVYPKKWRVILKILNIFI